MRHGTDHTANNVAICTKPHKTQERCLHEKQRGSRAFLCGEKPVTENMCKMTRASCDLHKFCIPFFLEKDANTIFDVA